MKGEIWILDDEKGILETLEDILKDENFQVRSFLWGKELLKEINFKQPKVILLDLWLKDIDGFEVLEKIKKTYPEVQIIVISGHGNIETAVKAIKMGAFDFIEKPLSYERVIVTVENALKLALLEEENKRLRENIFGEVKLSGVSPAIQKIRELILKAAPTDTTVLIQGESGVGKEIVAKLIHLYSKRAKEAFVEINCAAIPETLIESELFGYEKGAFTGAQSFKKGKLELAHKGTLFLDEIGDLSLDAQAKLLRVLQEKRFERLGSNKSIEIDVRIISATNKDLLKEIQKGKFREDLFFRINVFPIFIPPLRERKEDIPILVEEFLEEFSYKIGCEKKIIKSDALEALMEYDWPGNVRELKNFIERLVIISSSSEISYKDLPSDFKNLIKKKESLQENTEPWFKEKNYRLAKLLFEKEFLKRKLLEYGGNISKTAREIGLERAYLQKKIKEFNLKAEFEN
ncbi:two component, sigma54 specific, transcriptional regulator, Fis family [Thermodesulfobacterium geofontis OPF15]|uniref:Two component, sigma54 specific, transcriptional regulator, Fis family n=1 Tax=Thermodesulfobacterium geofontis (strain OPF15) TaxID=795359 RepID=F8C4H2_THEGP|nr:sigma-54 dependent transcriptional regulator [Thermodesulfobacterium geofontis]AEH22922.1 two component, sigma54 specific, transcriptional regulator, Fis family [Thermodesulfobacterium geofontis OPF15]